MAKRKHFRRQYVIDSETDRTIRRLAANSDTNQSRIVREGIRLVAEQEAMFDAIEADPKFIAMMEKSEADFRAERFVAHDDVVRQHLALKKKGK